MKSLLPLLLLLCLGASSVNAQELRDNVEGPSTAQLLKVFGHLQEVPLNAVSTLAVSSPAIASQRDIALDVNQRLCLNPDKPDRDIAAADPKALALAVGYSEEVCADIIAMHQQLLKLWQQARGGRGSWPLDCHPDHWKGWHSAKLYVDYRGFNTAYKAPVTEDDVDRLEQFLRNRGGDKPWHSVEQAKRLWVGQPGHKIGWEQIIPEASRRIGCPMILVDNIAEANVEVKSISIAGNVIGYAYFNNQRCGTQVRLRVDNTWRPNRHRQWLLSFHELLHTHNGQHTFTGQSRHRGVLSYAWKEPFVGLSNGESHGYDRPKDPAWTQMIAHYNTDIPPRKGDDTSDPTEPPGESVIRLKSGDKLTVRLNDDTVLTVTPDESEGPTLASKVKEAYAAIPDYAAKEADRKTVGNLYHGFGQAVVSGEMTAAQGHTTISLFRGFMVRGGDKWGGVWKIADAVTTGEGFLQVAQGLGYNAADSKWTAEEEYSALLHAKGRLDGMAATDFQIPDQLLEIINQVIDKVFPGAFGKLLKFMLPIIIGIIGNAEEAEGEPAKPAKPAPAQRVGSITFSPAASVALFIHP